MKPEWLYAHTDFYDDYPRKVKVFSGEYAAHPANGFNKPEANTLEGALAEAAFLTGVERNADAVVLASYAPLFARLGYTQWSPDMIWFDASNCYGSPSYYVQKMYANNMGDVTLDTCGGEKDAAAEGIYYSVSFSEAESEMIIKIVNSRETEQGICLELPVGWKDGMKIQAEILTGAGKDEHNSIEEPEKIVPYKREYEGTDITMPPLSFMVLRVGSQSGQHFG